MQDATIFALSSAPGRAGVSVLRLSGLSAGRALTELTRKNLPKPRAASLRAIYNGAGEMIDKPLVLWFPAPKSFTGEDCAEIHVHGSVAILEAAAARLTELGLRQARPGEFTRRAVEHGKMDLTEAEGLADLIDAWTEGQRVQALSNMGGALRETYEGWKLLILDALAQIEGEIDFADEADVPDALSHAAYPFLEKVHAGMMAALASSSRGRAVRDGLQVAIIGAPNAARARAEDAHLVVHVARGDSAAEELQSDILFRNLDRDAAAKSTDEIKGNALSGAGVELLLAELERLILEKYAGLENAALTRIRHVDCITSAVQSIESAKLRLGSMAELASEDLRKSLKNIEELAGRSDMEQVFDRIFSSFCIGK